MKILTNEKTSGALRKRVLSALFIIFVAVSLIPLSPALAQDRDTAKQLEKKIRISTKGSGSQTLQSTVTRSKSSDTTRSSNGMKETAYSSSSSLPKPTKVDLIFPTLVKPNRTIKGKVKFKDYDDYVFSIFATVFFPDGDVVTVTLYDYREEGGDIWKGTIDFWVDIPESETPLPGSIIITCTDEYLNVSQVSKTFIQNY